MQSNSRRQVKNTSQPIPPYVTARNERIVRKTVYSIKLLPKNITYKDNEKEKWLLEYVTLTKAI